MKSLILFTLCCCLSINLLNAQDVVINEFMASNDSSSLIVDDFGDSDDWVELYNNSSSDVDISGYHLSDNDMEMDQWSFPNGITISGDGYLIVWTDSDNGQGDLHTNFKLSAGGEYIVLSDPDLTIVDDYTFGEQTTNIPMARVPNGTGDFVTQPHTFNASNDPSNTNTLANLTTIKMGPNPASAYTIIQLEFSEAAPTVHCRLINSLGQVFYQQTNSDPATQVQFEINTSALAAGIYFVELEMGNGKLLRSLVVQ